MRLENCLEDMSVISNALATVTSTLRVFQMKSLKPNLGVPLLSRLDIDASVAR